MQSRLLIVCGVPGSGKSTFARHVAGRWNASWFASETFANELGAAARSMSGDLSEQGIEYAYKAMATAVKVSLATNRLVIAVGSFRSDEQRKRFRDIASDVKAAETTIRIVCPAEIAAERIRLRFASGERGPNENTIREIDAELSSAPDIDCMVNNSSSFSDFYRHIDTVIQDRGLVS